MEYGNDKTTQNKPQLPSKGLYHDEKSFRLTSNLMDFSNLGKLDEQKNLFNQHQYITSTTQQLTS